MKLPGFPGGISGKKKKKKKTHLPLQETQEIRVRSLGQEGPLEEGITTHSNFLAWTILMDRGAWQATVDRTKKSQTRLKQLSMHT